MKSVRNIILALALFLPSCSLAQADSVYTPKKKAPYVSFLFSFSILRFGLFDP